MNETLGKLRLNGNKIKTKGGMAIAGALQVNTMLEELDLGETDQVMYIVCSCQLSVVGNAGQHSSQYAQRILEVNKEKGKSLSNPYQLQVQACAVGLLHYNGFKRYCRVLNLNCIETSDVLLH